MTNLQVKADFTGRIMFIGIDIHLKNWHVSLYYEQKLIKSFRQEGCPKTLSNYLNEHYPGAKYVCAYESGFSGFWAQRQLEQLGIECIVVHAADVPQTNKGKHFKTDKMDSKRIGAALGSGMLRGIYIPEAEAESDRQLVRCNVKLGNDVTACKHRIKSMLYQLGISIPQQYNNGNWSNKFMTWLKDLRFENESTRLALDLYFQTLLNLRQEKLNALRQIRRLQNKDRYSKLFKLLTSIPGIGPMTAITLLTEIVDMKRFNNFDELNSFIGFCPNEYSSGDKERKGRMSFRQHKRLRSLLIENAWIAIRNDPALLLYYSETKAKLGEKRAIVKIARKLVSRIRMVWNNEKPYEIGVVATNKIKKTQSN
ncbi:MAG: IS110 family transposase [Saprospiraceae bacterium]|jgi:transposase|nr:IS110 family transposase [Saprospiraceae bacterium]MBK6859965.1 IS110 family transposase [Saprospiraceae bacterium]MBK6860162.1 IS110 family transposase [Saprospiraceae bacterium]MBK8298188.1 IS110 family transposase [Saprospiraceae bacterium]